eukprot:TRINITY_DN637_c3_g1_i2.p1 TRINITY_DN637_c3_g1~~TRINITY_DN637_c3_g1_i2.p1  ORF type:complete len:105 (+),score=16.30 TRINITY_DN637_c3_g1_i2:91-405(+)
MHSIDNYLHAQLLYSAIKMCRYLLKEGGKLVVKVFMSSEHNLLLESQLRSIFESVVWTKPLSSRYQSVENFVVCERFIGVHRDDSETSNSAERYYEFGDLSVFD